MTKYDNIGREIDALDRAIEFDPSLTPSQKFELQAKLVLMANTVDYWKSQQPKPRTEI